MDNNQKSLEDHAKEFSAAITTVILEERIENNSVLEESVRKVIGQYTLALLAFNGMRACYERLRNVLVSENIHVPESDASYFKETDATLALLDLSWNDEGIFRLDYDGSPIEMPNEICQMAINSMHERLKTQAEKVRAQGRKIQAKAGAYAKLANDPVQAVKPKAYKLWQDWQSGKTLHKSGAAFHRFVREKFPVINDTQTVRRWCKDWRTNILK